MYQRNLCARHRRQYNKMRSCCEKRNKSEMLLLILINACMLGSIGLCVASMVVPNWAHSEYIEGIVVTTVDIGMVRIRQCDYQGCRTHWFTEHEYEHIPEHCHIESGNTIRSMLSSGMSSGFLALGLVWAVWNTEHTYWCRTLFLQVSLSVMSLFSTLMCATGPLITAVKVENKHIGFAPILAAVAGSLMFTGFILSSLLFFLCRSYPYPTPSVSTVPVPAKKRPITALHVPVLVDEKGVKTHPLDLKWDKDYFVSYDYNSYIIVDEEKKVPL